jgi:hypothetical protein
MFDYKINKLELEALLKKVYEEACFGYLDLQDSVCQKMLNDFLTDKKPVQPMQPIQSNKNQFYTYASSSSTAGTYSFYSNLPPENPTEITIVNNADDIRHNEFFERFDSNL